MAQSGSEAGTDADGELPEPTSAAGNGDAAAQAAQVLPNAAVNPEPPSSMDADMQDAEQQAGEQQAPADPLDLLPPEYRTSPGEVDPVLQVREAWGRSSAPAAVPACSSASLQALMTCCHRDGLHSRALYEFAQHALIHVLDEAMHQPGTSTAGACGGADTACAAQASLCDSSSCLPSL